MFVKSFQKKVASARHTVVLLFFATMLSSPIFAFAQTLPAPISDIKTKLTDILNYAVFFLIALAFVVFLWGIYKYITAASLDGKEGARATIIYGLIGLFVMLAAWGLVNILLGTFGFTSNPAAPAQNKIPKAFGQPSSPTQQLYSI